MFSLLAKLEAGIAFSHLITYKYNIKSIILNKNNIQSRYSIDIIHSFYLIKDMEYRLKLHPTFVNYLYDMQRTNHSHYYSLLANYLLTTSS